MEGNERTQKQVDEWTIWKRARTAGRLGGANVDEWTMWTTMRAEGRKKVGTRAGMSKGDSCRGARRRTLSARGRRACGRKRLDGRTSTVWLTHQASISCWHRMVKGWIVRFHVLVLLWQFCVESLLLTYCISTRVSFPTVAKMSLQPKATIDS